MGVTSSMRVMVMPARVSVRGWRLGHRDRCCWKGSTWSTVLDDEFVEFFVLEGVSHAFSSTGGGELTAFVLASLDDFTAVAGGDGFTPVRSVAVIRMLL